MAKIDEYREAIQKMLAEYAERDSDEEEVELQKVFDTKHDHYQLIYVGWDNRKRIFGLVMHLDIKNEKIWIQWNGTQYLSDKANCRLGGGFAEPNRLLKMLGLVPRHQPTKILNRAVLEWN
ncbi:hypothetical protein DSM106972_069040 [Dulcicalothrix desertica PCC 7102]|uniref:XisI protein n=1 Tax=Dulcicalothrix desertica PCC 7102 TaxID=232991 RepID=A0A433V5G3_9CYAN|nr:XisI protein [Dulcicalothrix desertica]RUT01353.1 hypothetical protein DSM106972_069040 [Dulcicalothrix desertica PCC 7102]